MKFETFLIILMFSNFSFGDLVIGRNFSIPATQQIYFIPLKKMNTHKYSHFPKKIDLRSFQSAVKSQGPRGACTYFVMTSLAESLIKQSTGQELDLSEEYLAWAAKTKKKLSSLEEDSSVAVNAVTIQDLGFMLESDLPYQQSWFDKGYPCEGQKNNTLIDPICYSHSGPIDQSKVITKYNFEFKDLNSSSLDIVEALATWKNAVTVSILAHPKTWKDTIISGDLTLPQNLKKECQDKLVQCSGHAALIVGYDLEKRIFYFKNSWGEKWGQNGYGTITFDYIDQMSDRKLLTGCLSRSKQICLD